MTIQRVKENKSKVEERIDEFKKTTSVVSYNARLAVAIMEALLKVSDLTEEEKSLIEYCRKQFGELVEPIKFKKPDNLDEVIADALGDKDIELLKSFNTSLDDQKFKTFFTNTVDVGIFSEDYTFKLLPLIKTLREKGKLKLNKILSPLLNLEVNYAEYNVDDSLINPVLYGARAVLILRDIKQDFLGNSPKQSQRLEGHITWCDNEVKLLGQKMDKKLSDKIRLSELGKDFTEIFSNFINSNPKGRKEALKGIEKAKYKVPGGELIKTAEDLYTHLTALNDNSNGNFESIIEIIDCLVEIHNGIAGSKRTRFLGSFSQAQDEVGNLLKTCWGRAIEVLPDKEKLTAKLTLKQDEKGKYSIGGDVDGTIEYVNKLQKNMAEVKGVDSEGNTVMVVRKL